jgi:hypothetical protein
MNTLAGIDGRCSKLNGVRDTATDKIDELASAAVIAVILDRYPNAAFVELDHVSENFRLLVTYAILDGDGWPLWFRSMIGPRNANDEAFEAQLHKYIRQMKLQNIDRMSLQEPRHSMYAGAHHNVNSMLGEQETVSGIQIIT